jgi:hypothetical protein
MHGQYIEALGISADGAMIASVTSGTSGGTFQLWSATGEKIGEPVLLERGLIVRRIRFSADGRAVALLPSQDTGFVVLRRGEVPFVEPAGEAFLGFLADGGLARTDRGNIIIEGANGAVRRRFPYHADYTLRAVLPDGLRALVNDGVATRVLPLEALGKPPERASLWLAGEAIFAAVAPGGDTRVIFRESKFVSTPLGRAARFLNLEIDNLQLGHASPDGSRIVIDDNSRQGRYLRFLDEEGKALAPAVSGFYVAFPPDSSRIAVGAIDEGQRSSLAVFDRNGAPLWRIELGAGALGRLAYSHDGERIAVAVKGAIRIFDREGKPVGAPLETGMSWMTDLAPTPDGGWMVLGGDDAAKLHFFSAAGARIGEAVTIPSGRASRARYVSDSHILTRDDGGALRLWTRAPGGALDLRAAQLDVPYYSIDHGIMAGRFWAASRHMLSWFDGALRPIAATQLVTDGHVVVLADGRHCGAGAVFANRRAFRGVVELSTAERDALVDCAAVRAALGGR